MSERITQRVARIDVPIMGIPVVATYVYVIDTASGPVLIDAGWNDDDAWNALVVGLAELGHDVSDVAGVIITHFHPDHAGLSGRLVAASGCWVAMHERDVRLLDDMAAAKLTEDPLAWELENLRNAGAPEQLVSAYAELGGGDHMAQATVRPDRSLADGAVIEIGDVTLETVATPGHTAGHIAVLYRAERCLFTGDHVLSDTTPHVGNFVYPVEERDPLGEYLKTLIALTEYADYHVLPAHEGQIADLDARSREIVDHHEVRLAETRTVLAGQELTVWGAASRMVWHQAWEQIEPLGVQLALAETAAHLRHLIARGEVLLDDSVSPARFVLAEIR